jgi:hypothetical protein
VLFLSAVYFYRAFGQILASEFPLPELRPTSPDVPRWTIRFGGVWRRGAEATGVVLGSEPLYQGYQATLTSTDAGWRILVGDTGEYEFAEEGRTITVWRYPEGSEDFLRGHLLGRVIAATLHREGMLVLHGSAVGYPAGASAFLAPKGTGKSTLALALTLGGGKLLSDDALPVRVESPPMVWPGVHSMRLREDSVEQMGGGDPATQRADGKYLVGNLPDERLEESPQPLRALYLLVGAERIAEGGPVARRRLAIPAAATALVGMSKIPLMLGKGEGPELLRRAVQLASRVPVYQLMILRDMQRLPEVAARIAEWQREAVA